MRKTVLITGASSGIGREYAKQLSLLGHNLVLVARDQNALAKLARELHGDYEIIAADLLNTEGLKKVENRILDTENPINFLINNAGFGLPLSFDENDLKLEVDHMRIHNEIPMRLCHAAIRNMRKNGGGTIINVASVAAFIPRSTYAASKRWLVSFSQWANGFYSKDEITVTAVCPGFTHTNFHERMGLPPGDEGIPGWMWLDSKKVVRESLSAANRGKSISIPSLRYKILVALSRIAPPGIAAKAGAKGRKNF